MNKIVVGKDGSVMFRRPFKGGTIALQRLQFSSNLGIAFYILNAIDGCAHTLKGAHHYAGNITHPRQGFREMGVLEIDNE